MWRSLSIAIGCSVFFLTIGISSVSAQTATETSTTTSVVTSPTGTPTTIAPTTTSTAQSPTNSPVGTSVQLNTPTVVATAVATGTPTRTPTAVVSPSATRTAIPTRTATATKTPSPKIIWMNSILQPEQAPGEPVDQTVTFGVRAPMSDVTVRVFSPGNAVLVGSIPSSLQPGETYQLPITITVPTGRNKWPIRATIMIRSGNRSIGPVLFIRATGPKAELTPGSAPSTTGPGRPSATPTSGKPTTGSTNGKVEVTWNPGTITQSLSQGSSSAIFGVAG